MKRIKDILVDIYPPENIHVLWNDISKSDGGILKKYVDGEWIEVTSDLYNLNKDEIDNVKEDIKDVQSDIENLQLADQEIINTLSQKVNIGSEDSSMSSESTNSVQNKVIKLYVDEKSQETLSKFVRYDIGDQSLSTANKSNARTNIDSDNIVAGYYLSPEDSDEEHESGFYGDIEYTLLITNEYVNSRKIYLDLNTMILYGVKGSNLVPVKVKELIGLSITSVSYNNNRINIYFGENLVSIPVSDIVPLIAGKGIKIENGTISQNYEVVSYDWMKDYLDDPPTMDDGIIRYVYEED